HRTYRRSYRGSSRKAVAHAVDDFRNVRSSHPTLESEGGPVSHTIGLMIESIVAGLLVVTIGYCIILNKRLVRLKADEMSLKATISELITATEIAERAVAGLKVAVRDCDRDIGERLRAAERFSIHVAQQIKAGEDILTRLAKIAAVTQ